MLGLFCTHIHSCASFVNIRVFSAIFVRFRQGVDQKRTGIRNARKRTQQIRIFRTMAPSLSLF
jgi:hypothetical protein